MKTLLLTLTLLFTIHHHKLAAQTDAISVGGPIVSNGATLQAPLINPCPTCGTTTGTTTLQTGPIASGDYQNSATFASGGSFTFSSSGISFSGIVTSASWSSARAANGTYTYTLSGNIQDSTTGQTGAFVLLTNVVGVANMKFSGNAVVNYISIHLD